jgi:hypothetical protein
MTKEEQESFGPPAQKISHKGVSQSSMALAVAEGENNL